MVSVNEHKGHPIILLVVLTNRSVDVVRIMSVIGVIGRVRVLWGRVRVIWGQGHMGSFKGQMGLSSHILNGEGG